MATSMEVRMARMEGSAEHFATKADIKDLEVRLTRLIYTVGVGLGLGIIANIAISLAGG